MAYKPNETIMMHIHKNNPETRYLSYPKSDVFPRNIRDWYCFAKNSQTPELT